MNVFKLLIAFVFVLGNGAYRASAATNLVQGYNLTEIGEHLYDASTDLATKTEAQNVIDRLFDLGVRHINLTPRARMTDPRGSEVIPYTALSDRAAERDRYRRLITYIKSKGMTAGIRPIFFVVDSAGRTPYLETLPDGTQKSWWHGNIQPRDPNAWFESFRTYLDVYLTIAKIAKVDEFTIGAELYSMTVGVEDQWKEFPYGFPGRWLELLKYSRGKLGSNVRIMYDINFTDDKAIGPSVTENGGEFARWRYRLVDLANPSVAAERKIWEDLRDFWLGLDAIGIDMYRSLGTETLNYSGMTVEALAASLKETTDRYASQLDNAFVEIESVVGKSKPVIFKEVGFRSVTRSFLRPFEFASASGEVNLEHQAAAFKAYLDTFHGSGFGWYRGTVFWDASVSELLHGPLDKGFSPLGKPLTEDVIRKAFGGRD